MRSHLEVQLTQGIRLEEIGGYDGETGLTPGIAMIA